VNRWVVAVVLLVATIAAWIVTDGLAVPARALTVFLLVPLPFLSIAQTRALGELMERVGAETVDGREAVPQLARMPVYIMSAITLWLLAIVTLVAASFAGFTARLTGLAPLAIGPLLGWTVFVVASAVMLYAFGRHFGLRESRLLHELLPRSPRERAAFVGLSITAGVCEEFVFRGFLVPALTVGLGSVAPAAVISSAVFGILHSYQRAAGAARAGLLGVALAVPFLYTGSLLPSMIAHTTIDLLGGFWLVRKT
jgi:membrane protease YdiL (CAAX protease family)